MVRFKDFALEVTFQTLIQIISKGFASLEIRRKGRGRKLKYDLALIIYLALLQRTLSLN